MSKPMQQRLSPGDISRVIEMAWEDHTPFEAIQAQFGLNEAGCIALMRREMQASSFRMWRRRVTGRASKHSQRAGKLPIKHRAYAQAKAVVKPKR